MKFKMIAPAALLAAAIAAPTLAQADDGLTRATYLLTVTDPNSGNVAYVSRESIRSWPSAGDCETQKETFSAYHVDAVEDMKLRTEDKKPHVVEIASITCHPEGKK